MNWTATGIEKSNPLAKKRCFIGLFNSRVHLLSTYRMPSTVLGAVDSKRMRYCLAEFGGWATFRFT